MQLTHSVAAPSFMIILVGLPGSGKTTFARLLTAGNADKFVHINQDRLKTRIKCESLCRESLLHQQCPIIDRCNFDTVQRGNFLSIAREANVPIDVVVFSYSLDECIHRCEQRTNHETVKPNDARRVMHMISSQYDPPKRNSSDFRRVIYVSSFHEANQVAADYLEQGTKLKS